MRRAVRNVLGAGAAVLCLGGLLSACGGDSGDGYVATGPAGASPERAPGKTVAPTGDVELVPLDRGGEGSKDGGKRGGGSGTPSSAGTGGSRGAGGAGDTEGKSPGGKGGSGSADAADPTGGAPSPSRSPGGSGDPGRAEGHSGTPSPPGTGKPTTPAGPAKLGVGDPERKPADKRWCEKVTVAFHNTGGSPVRSGTVTFGTHIIGALGVDWATIESTVELPAPIGPGQKKEKTWPVCVDAWRVPLGMHVETQDVSVDWK